MRLSDRVRKLVTSGLHRSFGFWERLGFHITPVHFYEPIPDSRELSPTLWTTKSSLAGIDMNSTDQVELLKPLGAYQSELAQQAVANAEPGQFCFNNGLFDHTDAKVLYGLVRHCKPKRIIEVGSGFSSLVASHAIAKNRSEGHDGTLTCIEPYPVDWLRDADGVDRLIESPVQHVPMSEFEQLGPNDVLFIDSSHVLRVGSDVQFEFLDVLPRLRPGVIVHVHDIFLPEEYPRSWVVDDHRFWTEQYLLQAFLAFNDAFEVLLALNWLRIEHPAALDEAFGAAPGYRPGSFWIRRAR